MARIFWDGFEGLSASTATLRWTTFTGNPGTDTTPPPASGLANVIGFSFATVRKDLPGEYTALYLGVRVLFGNSGNSAPGSEYAFIRFNYGETQHVVITVDSTYTIRARRGDGGTVLATSSVGVVAAGQYYYIQVFCSISDTTGEVIVKRGSDTLISESGLDTRNGSTAAINRIELPRPRANDSQGYAIDDVYVCDDTGPAPFNTFLGDIRIIEQIVDASDSVQFTPNTGTNHGAVDDPTNHDSDSTYNASSTAGHKDVLGLAAPVTAAGTIYAAKVVVVARKDGVGDQSLHVGTKFGTTEDVSAPQSLTDTYAEYRHEFDVNPDTLAALTPAAIGDAAIVYSIPE